MGQLREPAAGACPAAGEPARLGRRHASAPFVATLSDVTGLLIYFTIANLILAGTLL